MPKIIRNGVTYAGLPDIDYDCEITTITLYAANWSNGVYTITDSRIDGTSVQEYMPGLGITDEQLEALQAANIHDFGQDAGHAYLKAYGDVPSIDIPIRIMFNPGVKTKEVDSSPVIKRGRFVCPAVSANSWTNITNAVVFDKPMPSTNYIVFFELEVADGTAGTRIGFNATAYAKTVNGYSVTIGTGATAIQSAGLFYVNWMAVML